MGAGLTMGLGAQIAAREVIGRKSYAICIEGDGSFGMNLAELATATQFQIPVTVVVMNNEALGMIKDHQRFDPRVGGDRNGQGKRFIGTEFKNPDFARMAEAFHCYGERVEEPQQIRPALENAMKANDKGQTAVLDCMINKDAWWDYNRY
jgi:acetolactate synthase-1/2/3 large subunit